MRPTVLALDAMGVLYRSADDVADLLVPYLRDVGCSLPTDEIERLYVDCSLGTLSSNEFWNRAGVASRADDTEYCGRHELTPGVDDLLAEVACTGWRVACVSNDVVEWSLLLRRRFGLAERIPTWVVSGEVGARKPDRAIYEALLERLDARPADVVLVDDRPSNVDAAAKLGMRAVQFGETEHARAKAARASSMAQLREVVASWT